MNRSNSTKTLTILVFAFIGWALCGAIVEKAGKRTAMAEAG